MILFSGPYKQHDLKHIEWMKGVQQISLKKFQACQNKQSMDIHRILVGSHVHTHTRTHTCTHTQELYT